MTGSIEQLQQRFELRIRWRAFPLHPETPDEGRRLEDLFRASPQQIEALVARLQEKARELGLPFGPRSKTYNSRKAQELGLWAEDQGRGEPFHKAAFAAYFVKGWNLADVSVLQKLAESVGLSPTRARSVLAEAAYGPAVDRDWQESRQLGITAVPTFVMGRHTLVGAQDLAALSELVRHCGARERQETA